MKKIYIIGDIHGDYKPINNLYHHLNENTENCTLIILGDFGGNYFFNYRDIKFKQKLSKYKFTYFIIRGNHEERPSICREKNPNDWHMESFWEGSVYVENKFPYIKYALDYPSIYLIPNQNGDSIKTLVLPGAYSADKYHRLINNWSWFPHEQCTETEMRYGEKIAKATFNWNLVLSHTCPVIYEPTDLFLPMINQSTVDRTTERWLGKIEHNLNYKLWCWGHFHANRIYPVYNDKDKVMVYNTGYFDLYNYFNNGFNPFQSLHIIGE